MGENYRIWANHAHLFPTASRPEGDKEHLKQLMEECGIEKAVCFACFKEQYERSGLPGDPVSWIYEECRDDPSLIPFGTIDFERDDIAYQVERIADFGIKGIKIHPAFQEINIMGDKAQEVYRVAQEKKLFLSFHTGLHWHRIHDYNVLLFDDVAWFYPELRFSMEHMGGYHFFKDALAVMCNADRNSENNTVFAGWTSVHYAKNGLPDKWTVSDEELRTLISQTGNERSIFGLDFPYNKADRIKEQIERFKALDIPEEAKEGILGGNLRKVLDME